MNAIIFSAVWGMVMMFCSFLISNKSMYRHIAAIGLLLLLAVNILESRSVSFVHIDAGDMLVYTRFGYLFNSIAIASTLIYVLLTGKDIERLGSHVAEYFVLIFFVLCGVCILSAYNNL